jgi:biofilm PGA synthesis N-glycosyltransferase PgaC
MRLVFWAAAGLVAYTYFGYPALLWLRSFFSPRPVKSSSYLPYISIVLVVRNEAAVLEQKVRSLLSLDYPADRAEIVVVSDGSIDDTGQILSELANLPKVRIILNRQSRGKASGINDAIEIAAGEIVVFTDARQRVDVDAVTRLMENFADPVVGCASGELMLGDPTNGEEIRGMGLYWSVERIIRRLESASGSVVGATGALYAVRRSLLVPIPPETILDDLFLPMHVVGQGARVILDSRARIWDVPDLGTSREFARKVRTLTGIYQLLKLRPCLLSRANPLRFEFISHKLLRLAVPFALFAALVSSIFLSAPIYRAALILQLLFYILSAGGSFLRTGNLLTKAAHAAFTFVVLNAAALVAFANFVVGRRPAWKS